MQEVNVSVAVRIRPILPKEKGESICIKTISASNQIVLGKDRTFTFDHVYPPSSQQGEIYEKCVANLVRSCLDGYNATVLAYGQTGSGKTYTMGTASDSDLNDESLGLIPRIVTNIFSSIKKIKGNTFRIRVSYLEVYMDELRDLLDFNVDKDPDKSLSIRDDENSNTMVIGAVERECSSIEEVLQLLARGSEYRHIGKTKMNEHSSRSHAIFTIFIEQQKSLSTSITDSLNIEPEYDGEEPRNLVQTTCGKIHCVDLAGSERANRTGNTGERFKESICINTGLLALGNVISALGDTSKKKPSHVPYRASKITRLLKDSLGGNSRTLMICCVSPAFCDMEETLNVLNFANRARNIKNKPIINLESNATKLNEMKIEIKVLREELYRERTRIGVISANSNSLAFPDFKNDKYITELENTIQSLKAECGQYKLVVDDAYKQLEELKISLQLTPEHQSKISDWLLHVNQINDNKNNSANYGVNSDDLDKDQEILKLKAIINKYEKDLHNDEEIFSDRQKESDFLNERIEGLEIEKQQLLELLQQSEATNRTLRDKCIQYQEEKQSTDLQSSLETRELMLHPRQRATSVPSHLIGNRLKPPETSSRNLHTSPASFSTDRILKQVRLRGQMLYSRAEDEDDVVSTYREEEADSDEEKEDSRKENQQLFRRLDKSRGTYRKENSNNTKSLQTIYDKQSDIKLPLRRMSQLNLQNKNDHQLNMRLKDQLFNGDKDMRIQINQPSNSAVSQSANNTKKSQIPTRLAQTNLNPLSDNQHWIEEKLELLVEQRRAAEALHRDLVNRENLIAEREARLEELNYMRLKNLRASQAINQDILRLSNNLNCVNQALAEKRNAADLAELTKQRDALQIESQRLQELVEDGQSLGETDQRRFIECEEAIDALNAAIDYNDELINNRRHIINSSPDDIVYYMNNINVQDAKHIIASFLEKIVILRSERIKLDDTITKLKAQVEEDQRIITQLETLVTRTEEKMEHCINQLHQQQAVSKDLNVENINSYKNEIKKLEKELFFYKSNCRELKHRLKDLLNSTPTPRLDESQDELRASEKSNNTKLSKNTFTPRPPEKINSESQQISSTKRSSKLNNALELEVNNIESDLIQENSLTDVVRESKIFDKSNTRHFNSKTKDYQNNSDIEYMSNNRASMIPSENSVNSYTNIPEHTESRLSKDSLITSINTKEVSSQRFINTPSLYDSLED